MGVTRCKRFAFDVIISVTGDTIVLRILELEFETLWDR